MQQTKGVDDIVGTKGDGASFLAISAINANNLSKQLRLSSFISNQHNCHQGTDHADVAFGLPFDLGAARRKVSCEPSPHKYPSWPQQLRYSFP